MNRAAKKSARGISLISAIFLLVVISLLATAISRSVREAGEGSVVEQLGLQALLVAESGAQVAVAHALPTSGPAVCTVVNYDFSTLGHRSCSASISCQVQSSTTDTIYEIESRGRCALASGEIAERVIQVSVQP